MIHQPHFLPWPGYIARCMASDALFLLDDVQFKRNHFQQRTRYVRIDGREEWLTLPVDHSTSGGPIRKVQIADEFVLARWQRPVREAYQHSESFAGIWGDIVGLISIKAPSLSGVTISTLRYLLELVEGRSTHQAPEVRSSSEIETSTDRTQRLIDLCASGNVTHLIMGTDAVGSHDCERLRRSGLSLLTQRYTGPTARVPPSGVSVLHHIFADGLDRAVVRMDNDWSLVPL